MERHTSAHDAAAYLVWLAARESDEDPDFVTPLKLQKLLYFVQGWSFAEWGRPFFAERIEAWRNGPVVPAVYQQYKDRERLPIVPAEGAAPPDTLSPEERALIRSVWDAYKGYSAYTLADLAHREAPYREAYRPQDARGRCSTPIDPERIKRAFVGRGEAAVARLANKRGRLHALARANTRALIGRDVF